MKTNRVLPGMKVGPTVRLDRSASAQATVPYLPTSMRSSSG